MEANPAPQPVPGPSRVTPVARTMAGLDWFVRNAAAVLLVAVVVVVLVGVIARYILSMSLPWSEEVARQLLVWLTFMGAAAATAKRSHIRVDTLYGRFKGRRRTALDALAITLSIVALVILIWASQALFGPGAAAISPGSGLPAIWTRIALPVASVLMIVFLVYQLYESRHAPPPPLAEEQLEVREEV